jgi:hypothetical protein
MTSQKFEEKINEMSNDIKTLLDKQALIKTQVEKTNGRVSSLEKFENTAKGAIAIIVIFILPIFFKLANEWISNHK